MNDYPIGSTAKIYHDDDGNPVTLRQLIKLQPEWAHTRIVQCELAEKRNTDLEFKLFKIKRIANYPPQDSAILDIIGNVQSCVYFNAEPAVVVRILPVLVDTGRWKENQEPTSKSALPVMTGNGTNSLTEYSFQWASSKPTVSGTLSTFKLVAKTSEVLL